MRALWVIFVFANALVACILCGSLRAQLDDRAVLLIDEHGGLIARPEEHNVTWSDGKAILLHTGEYWPEDEVEPMEISNLFEGWYIEDDEHEVGKLIEEDEVIVRKFPGLLSDCPALHKGAVLLWDRGRNLAECAGDHGSWHSHFCTDCLGPTSDFAHEQRMEIGRYLIAEVHRLALANLETAHPEEMK